MPVICSKQIGEFKGTVYLYKYGYTYKIRYHRKVVDQSYVYLTSKELAIGRMENALKMLTGFNKDLFDLERIK